jgi:hypothetical protein
MITAEQAELAKCHLSHYRYSLHVDGVPVASFRTFGEANHAAFDDYVGFDWKDAARRSFDPLGRFERYCAVTEVFSATGQRLAAYQLQQGKLARYLDCELGESRP